MSFDDIDEPDDDAVLALMGRFLAAAKAVPWFSAVGQPLDRALRGEARSYLDALGFPGAAVVPARDWREAADAAETGGFDNPAFEAEEQVRASLTADAVEALGEEAVEVIATLIQAELGPQLGEAALNATRIWGLDDPDLVNAAAGAGLQAAHAAALILAGGTADEDHPAALKFRLFERGRWPVGVIGSSFHLF